LSENFRDLLIFELITKIRAAGKNIWLSPPSLRIW